MYASIRGLISFHRNKRQNKSYIILKWLKSEAASLQTSFNNT